MTIDKDKCPKCNGEGKLPPDVDDSLNPLTQDLKQKKCPDCGGSGVAPEIIASAWPSFDGS